MKQKIVMKTLAIAVALLLAAPQQAEAQFLKKLGKAIGDTAKETWNNAKNAAKNNQTNGEKGNSSGSTLSTAENVPIEEPEQKVVDATDANNLNILGISLGQSKSTVESQLKANGFKDVTVYDSKETRGTFYGKASRVAVFEYQGKVTVSLSDVNSYTKTLAQQRINQLKQQLQGDGTATKQTGMGVENPSYIIKQKGGTIQIFYHDEDEMDGNSGRYMVECVFHNQEFNIE